MAINNYLSIVFLFLFFFVPVIHGRPYCPVLYCQESNVSIQFPFWIEEQRPKDCGLSGFNISCNNQQVPVLDIPKSGRFIVSSISYVGQKIVLKDPDNCLYNRLVKLNLTSSPFTSDYYRTYTILSCPKGKVATYTDVIRCLSNSTTDIVAATFFIDVLYPECKKIMTLQLPGPYANSFLDSLELTWNATSKTGGRDKARIVKAVIVSLVLSALVVSVWICLRRHETSSTQTSDSLQESSTVALASSSMRGTTNRIDDSFITSYNTITIGQSGLIEGLNDSTCAICLEDYAVNDTIVFLPECEHCFHIECIDKWMRTNSKCPICRKSQVH